MRNLGEGGEWGDGVDGDEDEEGKVMGEGDDGGYV